ncbi:hypothetical protein ACVI9W_001000 [Pseudomonas sp. 210_17 TE3656]
MAGQLTLQVTGFGQVVEQHQLAWLSIQRTGGNRQASTITQRHFVAVIFTRGETAGDHLAPQLAHQRLAKQITGGRIGLTHKALAINDNDPARQQIKQVLQTIGQALLLSELGHALGTDYRQLTFELGNPGFEQVIGLIQLTGDLVEQGEGLFQAKTTFLLGSVLPLRFGDTGDGGGLGHHALSRG